MFENYSDNLRGYFVLEPTTEKICDMPVTRTFDEWVKLEQNEKMTFQEYLEKIKRLTKPTYIGL